MGFAQSGRPRGVAPNPKTLGFAQTHKGLLEEKQRFATGSCNATAPLDRKNFN